MSKWNVAMAWSRSGGDTVSAGVRWLLLGLNTFLVLTGASMVVLGIKVSQHNRMMTPPPLPELWWLGIMPLTIGVTGMITTVLGRAKWVMAWAIYSTLVGTGSYIYYIRTAHLNTDTFGISQRIYDTCSEQADICACIWPSSSRTVYHRYTCQMLQITESIYLSQMILMTLSLAASIVGCFLASTSTCCYSCCTDEREEEQSLLRARTLTLNSLSTEDGDDGEVVADAEAEARPLELPAGGCQYKTDYVVFAPSASSSSGSTHTYVTEKGACASTML